MIVILIPLLALLAIIAINLLMLAGQVAKYQSYWSNQNEQSAPDNAITYVALGDSSAQSVGASSPEKGYVGLIAKSIEDETGRPVKVINLSKSGAKVRNVIDNQLPKIAEYNLPKDTIYTMQIGANDAVRDFDIDGFARDMEELLPLLPKQIIISDLPAFASTRFSAADENAQRANERLRELVKPYGFELAPLYEVTNQRASWRNNAIDMFHPNNRGYKNWFDAFWLKLGPKLKD